MQMTIRLPDEYSKNIEKLAKEMGLKKSDIARIAIRDFIASRKQQPISKPYTHLQQLIGIVESGVSDLGLNHREHIVERIRKQQK